MKFKEILIMKMVLMIIQHSYLQKKTSTNVFFLGGSEFESSGSEVNYDDIESMLDERLPEELRNKRKDQQYEERFKTIMEGNSRICTNLSFL